MPILNHGLRPLTPLKSDIQENLTSYARRYDIDKDAFDSAQKLFEDDIKRVLLINPGPSSKENGGINLSKAMDRTNQINVLCGSSISFIANGSVNKDDVDAIVFSNPDSSYEICFDEDTDLSGVAVFISKQCSEKLFDTLVKTGANIVPFDAYIEGISHEETYRQKTNEQHAFASRDMTDVLRDQTIGYPLPPAPKAPTSIAVGYGAAVSAVSIFSVFGHHDFEAIGWDGTREYAQGLEHFDFPEDEANPFDNDVEEFGLLVTSNPNAVNSVYLHGNGPTAKLLNADGNKPRTDFTAFEKVTSTIQSTHQPKKP